MRQLGLARFLGLAMLATLTACGHGAAATGDDLADAAADDTTDSTDSDADAGADALTDTAEPADALGDADAQPADAPADVSADAAPADSAQCQTDGDCTAQLNLTPCQLAKCTAGVCSAVQNPAACCLDSDCDDGNECNSHKCDQLQHVCQQIPIANCCSGKVLLQKAGFESGQDSFVATDGKSNGNVTWQQSTWRAHGGKKSLYFGNPCHSYDNSMTVAGACLPSPLNATPVSTTLLSKTYILPKNKQAQAHFWLWLDTEPSYATTLPAGTCAPPCNQASTCIQVGSGSVCEPEKDVLSLQVLAPDAPPATVFYSTQIGKTTLGDAQNPSGWRHMAVDLSAWQGKPVQLAWQFTTQTAAKNAYEGIYLDDIVVETICPDIDKSLCSAQSACPDDGVTCSADTCTAYSNGGGQGVCFHDAVPGCCLGAADCDDGNDCTADTCVKNQCKATPDATKPACCTPATLQSDTFSTAPLSGWVNLGLNSTSVFWRNDPKGGSPGGSLYFGNETFTNYDDPTLFAGEGPHGVACAKPVQLKQGSNYKLLQFDLKLDTEWSDVPAAQYLNPPIPGNPKLDWLAVQVLTGGVYQTVWSSDAIHGTTAGAWLPVTIGLDAFAGKSVQVCVRFDAGDATLNDKSGAHIDNFGVSEACQKADCYWDSDCPASACGPCQSPSCQAGSCTCAQQNPCP